MRKSSLVLLTGLLAVLAAPAFAKAPAHAAAPAPVAAPVAEEAGFKAGDILVHVRGVWVAPNTYTSNNTGALVGDEVKASQSIVPEVDASYFFTQHVAVEAIVAVTPHHIKTKNGLDLGKTWLLPPTVTAKYYFSPVAGISPYLGAGLNYTAFFGGKKGASVANVNYKNSWNPALQAGADFRIQGNWYANIDAKYIFISTDAQTDTASSSAHVNLNPLLLGVGVGYKF